MNKETMARDWIDKRFDFSMMNTLAEDMTRDDFAKCYLAGFEASQAQLLEQSSDEELVLKFIEWITPHYVPMKKIGLLHIAEKVEEIIQASALHSAKLLAEKDAEIERLKSLLGEE